MRPYDLGRRLDEAAAFMEQGKAVFVPVLLLSAKAEIERLRAEMEWLCRHGDLSLAVYDRIKRVLANG
jgi:hypothetical protein